MVEWSEAKCAGYALAALIAGDRKLEAAQALPEPVALRTRALVEHGGSAERDQLERRQLVERLLSAVRPEVALHERLPVRLRALLGTRLPRSQARALGLPSVTTRSGYAVPDDLWPRLYRIARYARYDGVEQK